MRWPFYFFGGFMRHHHKVAPLPKPIYGETYICDHPVYDYCTLYKIGRLGLAVIQQRYDSATKHTWWSEIDTNLTGEIYLHPGFLGYFEKRADRAVNGLYPTVTVRQIMWALRMKPLKKERWETVFDHKDI